MIDIIFDAFIDTLKLVPFLFVAFLLIELFEHKFSNYVNYIFKHKNSGVIVGSLLGAIPQCGFSVLATNLYVTRILTLGSLIAIYLSTSDEMIPIMISEHMGFNLIFKTVIIKIIIGIIWGIVIDLVLRKKEKADFHICDECHHDCDNSIIKSSLIHTFKIITIIFMITVVLNGILTIIPDNLLSDLLKENSILAPFISSLVGLIPNCGASVIITELYINNYITFGSMIAGLLTGAGSSLIVLFKANKNFKENIAIVCLLYFIGAISGIIINFMRFI